MAVKMPNYSMELDLKQMQRSPLEILRGSAEDLRDQTRGLVEGAVFTLNAGGSSLFRHTFYLRVPSLNDYTDPLFYAWHDANLYPVNVMLSGGKQGKDERECRTVQEFEAELERIFASVDTLKRLRALMVLAQK